MIDIEAIRARVRFWDDCSEVVMTQAEIDAKQLLAYVDELREAAGKVTCRTCSGNGHTFIGIDPCPDCADLRRLEARINAHLSRKEGQT